MPYEFKKWDELAWFVGMSMIIAILQALVVFEPDKITDWRLWSISLAGGAVRAGVGGALAWITSHHRHRFGGAGASSSTSGGPKTTPAG